MMDLAHFQNQRAAIFEQLQQNYRHPNDFFVAYSAFLDHLLEALWGDIFAADSGLVLVAIGGYGRQEVYPYSDIDIALVADKNIDNYQDAIGVFLRALWDMGLKPALKVGSIEEIAAEAAHDLTADTAFLEGRYLLGDAQLYERLQKVLYLQRDLAVFIEGKIAEQEVRHHQAQGGVTSLLEPNIKTCPGGLRDVHVVLWLARVQGMAPGFDALAKQKILTAMESRLLMISHRRLARARMALHYVSGRQEDSLLFDYQRQVAAQLGLVDDDNAYAHEKLMRIVYRATKTVTQMNGILLPMLKGRVYTAIERHIVALNADFYQLGPFIAAYDKGLFMRAPRQILRLIEVMQQHDEIQSVAPKTLRAWFDAVAVHGDDLYRDRENRRRFVGFFRRGHKLDQILRFLNLYGLLGRYLPAFGRIVGLLQHDLFHIYPVDDHILTVVRHMYAMANSQTDAGDQWAQSLMREINDKTVLYLAAFFHDIGKGRGGDHAIEGAKDADAFARDHGLTVAERTLLVWLVREHLLFSITAQKEDISNDQVIERFCQKVDSREKLAALYILTVADIRGTNPAIWSAWKAGLFGRLYQAALNHLQHQQNTEDWLLRDKYAAARDVCTTHQLSEAQREILFQQWGKRYFMRHEIDEIKHHWQVFAAQNQRTLADVIRRDDGTLQAMVYMIDQEGIFVRLCRLFAALGFDVLRAAIFVSDDGYLLDTFVLSFPLRFSDHDKKRLTQQLRQALDAFVLNPHSAESIQHKNLYRSERRRRHLPMVSQVKISPVNDSDQQFLIQITSHNRPGLLADVAYMLYRHGSTLHHARIHTLDARVEDYFVVVNAALADAKERQTLKDALIKVL